MRGTCKILFLKEKKKKKEGRLDTLWYTHRHNHANPNRMSKAIPFGKFR